MSYGLMAYISLLCAKCKTRTNAGSSPAKMLLPRGFMSLSNTSLLSFSLKVSQVERERRSTEAVAWLVSTENVYFMTQTPYHCKGLLHQ